jgi:small subunit ribosomal protein S3
MSVSEKSAVKSLLTMHRTYAELDEYLEQQLKEAGYAGVDVQKNPVGTRLTVFVTRPGLAIGRRGTGIKDLTDRVAQKFGLPNPQIAVSEVEAPELNPRIMAARTAQIVSRGTAFRRAATWTMNSIMAAGAAGVEIGVAGKLRSDRSHKEKYRMGVVPKSGETAERVVRHATTDVLLKLGLYGIQVKIALKDAVPPQIEFVDNEQQGTQQPPAPQGQGPSSPQQQQQSQAQQPPTPVQPGGSSEPQKADASSQSTGQQEQSPRPAPSNEATAQSREASPRRPPRQPRDRRREKQTKVEQVAPSENKES